MTKQIFTQLVTDVLETLPREFKEKMTNVAIIIEDEPTDEQRKKMKLRSDTVLFGLYEGVPLPKRAHYTALLPDKITLFQKSIERNYDTEDEIREQVRKTVLHEIGHYFGMSDRDLRRLKV